MQSAYELFLAQLREMLNAENTLVHVLGEQARESTHSELRRGFEDHRAQTQKHAERLLDIFRMMGETPEQSDCKGVDGLVEEKMHLMKQDPSKELLDFINVGAGIKVERYELSAYDSLLLLAEELGMQNAAQLLKQTRDEEQATLEKLQDFVGRVKPTNLGLTVTKPEGNQIEGGLPIRAA